MLNLTLRRTATLSLRSLHSSSSVARKHKAAAEDDADMVEDADLFDNIDAEPSSSGERGVRRSELVRGILANEVVRTGELRKVVQLSDSGADLEGLGAVLRAWRVSGRKVTTQTASEIVGRCINLQRPDLAKEYATNKLQYGLPQLHKEVAAKLAAQA